MSGSGLTGGFNGLALRRQGRNRPREVRQVGGMVVQSRGLVWDQEAPGSEVTRRARQLLPCCYEIKDEGREVTFGHREVEGILMGLG